MAHIHKHNDGWRAQVAKMGVRRTAVWPTKREAIEWATRLETEIKAGQHKPGATKTLAQAVAKYLLSVSPTKRDAVEWERRRFAALQDHFGDPLLEDITSERIGQWRDERLKTVSGSTVLREVNLYRNMFKLAVSEWKWLERSPFDGVRLPKESPPRQAVWPWQLIRRLLRAGQRSGGKTLEVTQAFHIALRTAMRLQEALAAPGGFDARRRVVTIPPSKTNPRPDVVPLTTQAHRLMLTMPAFGVGPNEASTLFSKLCKQNLIEGLEFRDSRATALTLMSRKMDILTLARISRHRDLDLLRRVYYRETAESISARL
jgi:hypothetical protein